MLFLGGFGQNFFLLQMVVHTPGKPVEERADYASRILLMLIIACALSFALIGMLVSSVQISTGGALGSNQYLLWIGLMSVAYLLKEFQIRHAFNEDKGARTVVVHMTLAISLLGGILVLVWLKHPLTLGLALAFYAGAHAVAAMVGHIMSNLRLTGHSLPELRTILAEISHGGSWASATNIVYFLRGQAHTIVIATLLGPIGVAKVNAARLLVTPAVLAIPAMSQIALPLLSRMVEAGDTLALMRMRRKIGAGLLLVAVVYSAILLVAWPTLSKIILGANYTGLFWIVALWCVYACFFALRNSFDWVAQAMRMFRPVAKINALSAAVTLPLVAMLAYSMGVSGAVMGVAFGELFVLINLWWMLKRRYDEIL